MIDAARIQAMGMELVRLADELSRQNVEASPPATDAIPISATEIRGAIRARRMRERILGEDLFADPAWDMLLELTASRLEGTQMSVSGLCAAADIASTTGFRHIMALVSKGLVDRVPDAHDKRRIRLDLSEAGWLAMVKYAVAVRHAGLQIV